MLELVAQILWLWSPRWWLFHAASHLMSERPSNLLEAGSASCAALKSADVMAEYGWQIWQVRNTLHHVLRQVDSNGVTWQQHKAKPQSQATMCRLRVAVQDGYIDKDELYFVLDRVGTFKKAKWSLAEFLSILWQKICRRFFQAICMFANCPGPICRRHWTNYWQAELSTELWPVETCWNGHETSAGLDTNSDGFVETWPRSGKHTGNSALHCILYIQLYTYTILITI